MRSKNSETELQRQTDLGNAGKKICFIYCFKDFSSPLHYQMKDSSYSWLSEHTAQFGGRGGFDNELMSSTDPVWSWRKFQTTVAAVLHRNGCMAEWTNGRLSLVKDTQKGSSYSQPGSLSVVLLKTFSCVVLTRIFCSSTTIFCRLRYTQRRSAPNICNPFQWLETCDFVTLYN